MSKREMTTLALVLVGISVAVFGAQIALFGRPQDTFFYLLQDLAFLPLTILIVTVLVSSILSERERRLRQHKMNMVIGAFFSQVGRRLLELMSGLVCNSSELCAALAVDPTWGEAELRGAIDFVRRAPLEIEPNPEPLTTVGDLLAGQRAFMLGLLENPTLLEHETFTDVLWAVFHLEEELAARKSLPDSPPADLEHLAGDARRAYSGLLVAWLEYMIHLSKDYPFLYSFAARTNPLRPDAQAEVSYSPSEK
jgi:hypothetical protein